jgi:putative transcriptional regulator
MISLLSYAAPATVCAPGWATPEATSKDTTLGGRLLVATPAMGDPRFAHTVILMARHGKTGAMGITINRPVGQQKMADLMQAVGADAQGVGGDVPIFAGGPVQPRACFVLHDSGYRRPGTIDVDVHLAMTSNIEVLRDISHHAGPQKYLIAFGYAGWGPGQFEGELAQNAWVTAPDDPALVFDADHDTVWAAATARAKQRF